jgi:small subunit ribosomal protein S17
MAKKLIGIVSSDIQDKTIVVTVTRRETHPLYGKQYTVTTKYAAHDEKNEAHKGDRVEISEIPPKSKRKSMKLDRVVEAGHGTIELKEEAEVK